MFSVPLQLRQEKLELRIKHPLDLIDSEAQMSRLLSIIGAISLGAVGMWLFGSRQVQDQPAQAPLVAIEEMGHLASVKVNYANVIEFTEKIAQGIPWTQWEVHLGGTKVLLVARGDCMVGTDLRAARYENTDKTARTADLVLPSPKLLTARVNHDSRAKGGSYFYTISSEGIEPLLPWSSSRTKAADSALARAQQDIERSCSTPDVLETAKKNAETVLLPTFSAIGWKVKLRWKQ